jgi:hypothetical protein
MITDDKDFLPLVLRTSEEAEHEHSARAFDVSRQAQRHPVVSIDWMTGARDRRADRPLSTATILQFVRRPV